MAEIKEKYEFRAIEPYTVSNIVDSEQIKNNSKPFILWGSNNDYPEFLDNLYKNVATLQSIIEGTVDFIAGDEIKNKESNTTYDSFINAKDETINELVRNIARDYMKYGGFAINVVRNKIGGIAGLYYIPFERIRSNEDNTTFYYCKDWGKTSIGRAKYSTYPKFNPDVYDANSVFYYSNNKTDTYPVPKWGAAIKACTIEMAVNDYHLNGIKNGFSANYLISFNNGIPSEKQADEIEENVMEKFGSEANSGRIMINFANDKEHSTEVSKLELDDVGERYKSLVERTKQEIFTSFRAQPQLFGLNLNTGFSTQEYEDAFALYNKTAVSPVQKIIARTIKYILGIDIEIVPFVIENKQEQN